jgi:hypothetical protein
LVYRSNLNHTREFGYRIYDSYDLTEWEPFYTQYKSVHFKRGSNPGVDILR